MDDKLILTPSIIICINHITNIRYLTYGLFKQFIMNYPNNTWNILSDIDIRYIYHELVNINNTKELYKSLEKRYTKSNNDFFHFLIISNINSTDLTYFRNTVDVFTRYYSCDINKYNSINYTPLEYLFYMLYRHNILTHELEYIHIRELIDIYINHGAIITDNLLNKNLTGDFYEYFVDLKKQQKIDYN